MPARRPPALLLGLLALVVGAGCAGTTGAPDEAPDRFDAGRAFAHLRAQVALGPRPAGSAASRALAERLAGELPNGRLEPLPGGLANVVGHLPGRGRAVLVGAHYDTKDLPGFVGANDGAAGTAVVVELGRALRRGRRACDREIRLVLFDGEESPRASTDFFRDGLRGSKPYAAAHAARLRAAVIVDFVGDRRLSIPRERGSNPALWARLRAAAARVGAAGVFPPRSRAEILDDHTPFRLAGVPAIDLIDFAYPHFHRPSDTLDKVSPRSLGLVGETLVVLLRELAGETCA
jgi:glutaminyl-peptide cyclotransferase